MLEFLGNTVLKHDKDMCFLVKQILRINFIDKFFGVKYGNVSLGLLDMEKNKIQIPYNKKYLLVY